MCNVVSYAFYIPRVGARGYLLDVHFLKHLMDDGWHAKVALVLFKCISYEFVEMFGCECDAFLAQAYEDFRTPYGDHDGA